jgi:molybdenum cofactor guanylyltransferase
MFVMTRRAAIILAGGKGERFQTEKQGWQDKILASLSGKPLLVHAIENVREVVDEIGICVNEEKRRIQYSKILEEYGITNVSLFVDEKFDHLGGPLVAIFTGLKSVDAEYCVTLPGDMPLVKPRVIEYMFDLAKNSRVVVPTWPNGRLETLIMILETKSTVEIAETLCQLQRPRSDDLIRGALNVIFASNLGQIREIDPDLKSFVNINSHADLEKLQPRLVTGDTTENLQVDRGLLPIHELRQLREAEKMVHENKNFEAARIFSDCAKALEEENSLFWAAISQENNGKSHIGLAKRGTDRQLIAEEKTKAKKALLRAAVTYELESEMHKRCNCTFLAERAISDKMWCESRAYGIT